MENILKEMTVRKEIIEPLPWEPVSPSPQPASPSPSMASMSQDGSVMEDICLTPKYTYITFPDLAVRHIFP